MHQTLHLNHTNLRQVLSGYREYYNSSIVVTENEKEKEFDLLIHNLPLKKIKYIHRYIC